MKLRSGIRTVLQTSKEAARPFYLKWGYFPLSAENCPRSFLAWRDLPSAPLRSLSDQFFPKSTDVADFVFLPMADWHGPLQRSQQLVRGLSRLGHRSLYLNPHLGREFRRPFPISEKVIVTKLGDRAFELHVHLPLEPVFHHRRLRPREVRQLVDSIALALRQMQSREQIVLISFPVWAEVARELKARLGSTIVYDCHDLIEGFGNVSADLVQAEGGAMEEADAVLFSADWLMADHLRTRPGLAGKSSLLRNAVDPTFFALKERSQTGKTPTIGYVGSLSSWFDSEWLRFAAQARPDWNFVLVGPCAQDFPDRELRQFSNVKLAGEVAYEEVPHWLATFDVAIIPFRVEPLTLGTNPIKLYEYFASGAPVVSSSLPEVVRYQEHVYLASTPQEFVDQIERALAEDQPRARLARRRIAESETWDARCHTLTGCLHQTPAY